ncbi:unnamed protein product, partial [Hapterophycus canaliculatus]
HFFLSVVLSLWGTGLVAFYASTAVSSCSSGDNFLYSNQSSCLRVGGMKRGGVWKLYSGRTVLSQDHDKRWDHWCVSLFLWARLVCERRDGEPFGKTTMTHVIPFRRETNGGVPGGPSKSHVKRRH